MKGDARCFQADYVFEHDVPSQHIVEPLAEPGSKCSSGPSRDTIGATIDRFHADGYRVADLATGLLDREDRSDAAQRELRVVRQHHARHVRHLGYDILEREGEPGVRVEGTLRGEELFRDLVEGHAANLGSGTCLGECHHKNREE